MKNGLVPGLILLISGLTLALPTVYLLGCIVLVGWVAADNDELDKEQES